jgi:hypothetical protein
MAKPASRDDIIDYSLRKLGAPVVDINVDRQQCEDRLDEALELFSEYHSDGAEKELFVYKITATDKSRKYIDVESIGQPIGATGSRITGKDILNVVKIHQFGEFANINMFDVRYQMALMDYFGINRGLGMNSSMGLSRYDSTKRYINMIQDFFNPEKHIRFNKITNKLNIDGDWTNDIIEGKYFLIEAYVKIEASQFSEVFNDIWLKKYLTSLIKRQWGGNMSKFDGVQLPGGVQLRGGEISQEAVQEIEKLEEELRLTYEYPIDFMTG